MLEGFITDQVTKAFQKAKEKFNAWLTAQDLDGNGFNDKTQILGDLEAAAGHGAACFKALADVVHLSTLYYAKYAPKKKLLASEQAKQDLA